MFILVGFYSENDYIDVFVSNFSFFLMKNKTFLSSFFSANISEEEIRWKHEFRQYQERVQQWDYYYTKYLDLLEKNGEKLFKCLG